MSYFETKQYFLPSRAILKRLHSSFSDAEPYTCIKMQPDHPLFSRVNGIHRHSLLTTCQLRPEELAVDQSGQMRNLG